MKQITREYLQTLSLKQLSLVDVKTVEDEQLLQEVIDSKTVDVVPVVRFNNKLVPDIKSPEMEKEWQEKIDTFYNGEKTLDVQIEEAQEELANLVEFIPSVDEGIAEETLTEEEEIETTPTVAVLNVEVHEQQKKDTKIKKTK